jgi:hypothetical protein
MSQQKRARKERRRTARSVQRELCRAGATARLELVRVALRDPGFDVALQDAISWEQTRSPLRHVDQVRGRARAQGLALKILRERGLDVAGIELEVGWSPSGGLRGVRAAFARETASKAAAAAQLRRVRVNG